MQISASNLEIFTKIEEELHKLDENFIKKFTKASSIAENISYGIELFTDCNFDDEIVLPNIFIISSIKFEDYIDYEKNSDGEIKENPKYQLEISGKVEKQEYKLVYTNLYKARKEIRYRMS